MNHQLSGDNQTLEIKTRKKTFFLKWAESNVQAEIENILKFFIDEKLINIDENQQVNIANADPKIRLLSALAHLYDVNVMKNDEPDEVKTKE